MGTHSSYQLGCKSRTEGLLLVVALLRVVVELDYSNDSYNEKFLIMAVCRRNVKQEIIKKI